MTRLETSVESPREGLLIGGEWVRTAERLVDIDPATGGVLTEFDAAGEAEVEHAVSAARLAQPAWAGRAARERGAVLSGLGALIRSAGDRLARLESLDTGKPLSQARTDVEVAAQYFEFYGGLADKLFGETMPQGGQALSFTLREPLGVTAHIVPWNYPIQISSRTVAPAMMAGNACVLKPAEEAPLSALALGELALCAGVPPGVLNIVPGSGEVAGAALAASDAVDHVAFTGGLETGRLVMAAAARNVKPVTMELGGKSPNIVFADADLDRAVPVIMRAVIQNAGQTCSAGARLIVDRSVHDEIVERLRAACAQVRVGRGLDDPDLGPLISAAQRDRVLSHLRGAVADGATVAAGGCSVEVTGFEGGYFVAPTLMTGVEPSAAIAQQEVFGPVLTVLQVDGEEEAAVVADGTAFGLVAGVWTRDLDRAVRLSRRLRCGQVFVNSYGAGGGVSLPFGGVKKSGFGREKGVEAAFEYTQTKSVVIDVAPGPSHG